MKILRSRNFLPVFSILLGITLIAWGAIDMWLAGREPVQPVFDGQRAYQDVLTQMNFGPRTVGSEAHQKTRDWLLAELKGSGWDASVQSIPTVGAPIENVIGKKGSGTPWIILGAHYDSRLWADQDPDPARRQEAVPGANDGASGVAVLTELARVLPDQNQGQVWLVFFDAEDNGDIPGYDWIMGSQAFADSIAGADPLPDAVVVLDMIGDADLNIYQERNSNSTINQAIWQAAAELGYAKQFIAEPKYSMLDDHTPFLKAGIPAVDLIDFDYPYWHTVADTADKVSAESLKTVGDTLLAWITSPNRW